MLKKAYANFSLGIHGSAGSQPSVREVAARDIRWTLDGVDDSTNTDYGTATTTTPLAGRYVPAG